LLPKITLAALLTQSFLKAFNLTSNVYLQLDAGGILYASDDASSECLAARFFVCLTSLFST